MPSSTPRTLARTATQVSRRRIVEPWYSMSSGAWPGDRAERAVDGADHVGDGDLVGRPGQRVAAVGPAVARDDPGAAQLEQDVLEELLRDALGVRQPLGRDRRPSPARRSSTSARIA